MRPQARADVVSLERTGWMVARSVAHPSMTRPPCCGFSVADADAAGVDDAEVIGPAGVQAVATSIDAAKTAMRTRAVRCFAVMYPPLVLLRTPDRARVYSGSAFATRRLYARPPPTVHFWSSSLGAGRANGNWPATAAHEPVVRQASWSRPGEVAGGPVTRRVLDELRVDFGTDLLRLPTARVEAAA